MTDSLPADIADATVGQIAELGEETRKTFSLSDYTQNITHRQERVLLYLDQQALDDWVTINETQERLSISIATLTTPESQENRARLQALYDTAEEEQEALHTKALQSAISIHLRALPDVAIKVLKRQVRKGNEDENGRIPQEKVEDVNDAFDRLVAYKQILEIRNSAGEVAGDLTEDVFKGLITQVGPVQRERVIATSKALQYTDQVAKALMDGDPGF